MLSIVQYQIYKMIRNLLPYDTFKANDWVPYIIKWITIVLLSWDDVGKIWNVPLVTWSFLDL